MMKIIRNAPRQQFRSTLGLRGLILAVLFSVLMGPQSRAQAQASSTAAAKLPVLDFRLAFNRIEPTSVTVPAGTYQLRLENGVVLGKSVSLNVTAQSGTRVAASQVAANASRGSTIAILTPGVYILQAGGRSQWQSTITVTSQ